MSKSLGNFYTSRNCWSYKFGGSEWDGAVTLAMLQTHYRQHIDWSVRLLEQSHNIIRSGMQLKHGQKLALERRGTVKTGLGSSV